MGNNKSIEELQYQNEKLKNKTEKLRLVRNFLMVLSIVISIVAFLFIKDGTSSTNNPEKNSTQTQTQNQQTNAPTYENDDLDDDMDDDN